MVTRLLELTGNEMSASRLAELVGVSQPFVSQMIAERDNTMTEAQAARKAQREAPRRPRSSPVDLSSPLPECVTEEETPPGTRADPNRLTHGDTPSRPDGRIDEAVNAMGPEQRDQLDRTIAVFLGDYLTTKQPIRTACPVCDHSFETSAYALIPADRTPESTTGGGKPRADRDGNGYRTVFSSCGTFSPLTGRLQESGS